WFTFWWAFGIAAFMVINLVFYPTFRDQAAQLNQALAHLPPAAKSLFAGSGTFSISTPEDFLSSRVFYLMLPLLLTILSIIIGSRLISKEENSGTLELLLSRPISRGRLLTAKAAAGTLILAVVSVAALMSGLIIGQLVEINVSVLNIEIATLAAAALSLLFGAISFTITALGRSARAAAAGAAAFTAITSYLIVSLSSVVEWLKWPSAVLPHQYYRPSEILYGNYEWRNVLGLFAFSLILGIVAWWFFRQRDIGV
ncbi:MAG: ABC transporter permease subunit, partial [Candidatus Saccharimonadales bacterium]